jgi:hypothetical protein
MERMMGLEPTTFCMANRLPGVKVTLKHPESHILSAEASG